MTFAPVADQCAAEPGGETLRSLVDAMEAKAHRVMRNSDGSATLVAFPGKRGNVHFGPACRTCRRAACIQCTRLEKITACKGRP